MPITVNVIISLHNTPSIHLKEKCKAYLPTQAFCHEKHGNQLTV
jgi:hypothetical protein